MKMGASLTQAAVPATLPTSVVQGLFTDAELRHIGGVVLTVEVCIALSLMLLVLLVGAVGHWRRQRREGRLVLGRAQLAELLTAPQLSAAALRRVAQVPGAAREALVLEFGRAMSGAAVERLSVVGRSFGLISRAERQCHSLFWWRRLEGARMLGALDHDCRAMRQLLSDPNPTVRAEVLHWAAGRADVAVIEALVARLSDPARLCRFTVRDSLLRVGAPAAVALEAFLEQDDAVALADALLVARGLAQPNLLRPAIRLASHVAAPVRARAAGVLGTLGGEEAASALLLQLRDDEWTVREAAARALGEIAHWNGASELAARLHDPSFPVRREAALSLRRLGGVGLLLLRRARAQRNGFAADMASQVLDLPNTVFHQMAA